MDGIAAIGAYGGGMPAQPAQFTPTQPAQFTGAQPAQSSGAPGTTGLEGQGQIAGASASASQSAVALSSTSITANIESFVGTYGPVMADNQILGAMLLLLMLQYMQSTDDEEKKGLLGLMLALAQSQQQSTSAAGAFMYSSSSLSIETTQMTAVSSQAAANVYTSGASIGATPAVGGASGGGVDMVA